jgi:hypothetical protein
MPAASHGHTLPVGIHDVIEQEPGYRLSTYWSNGEPGEDVLEVFVGKSEVLGSGVLVFDVHGTRFYPTPTRAVGLRIERRRGSTLMLLDRSGQRYFYDIASRQFIAH